MKNIFLLLFILTGSFARAQLRYTVKDLSELAQGSGIIPSAGYCINDLGDVAGHGIPTEPGSTPKAFMFNASGNTFINLGNLACNFTDGKGGNGYAINDLGQVAGRNSLSNESWDYRPFLFTDSNHNYIADAGEMVNLGNEPDHGYGWAKAINNSGQVVGFSNNETLGGWVWTDADADGVFDQNEKQYFGSYFPNSINDDGDIVLKFGINGCLWTDADNDGVYSFKERQIIPVPDGYFDEGLRSQVTIHEISPVSINNYKAICGAVENSFGKSNGFYWTDGNKNGFVEIHEYKVFGSALRQTYIRAMNNSSRIVGGTYEYHSGNRSAFIWTESGGMQNLNELADSYEGSNGPRWFNQAEAINDKGQIVANGWFDNDLNGKKGVNDPEHVFVLTPYLTGDINRDRKVDLSDLTVISRYYQMDAAACFEADINNDGTIDTGDLLNVVEDWLQNLN